jgi:hypothetical protein
MSRLPFVLALGSLVTQLDRLCSIKLVVQVGYWLHRVFVRQAFVTTYFTCGPKPSIALPSAFRKPNSYCLLRFPLESILRGALLHGRSSLFQHKIQGRLIKPGASL